MISRRDTIAVLATAGFSTRVFCSPSAPADAVAQPYADAASADAWMRAWVQDSRSKDPSAAKAPNGALHIGRFADPVYYLIGVVGWDPNPGQGGAYPSVRVPVGFVTDFASIPRIFWSLLRPDGIYSYAAIIHDYLYWEQHVSRDTADDVFKFCMEDFRIEPSIVATVYGAVRLGGGKAWSDNAALKAAGEKRVLTRFPTDPTVRWHEWKGKPDVFAGRPVDGVTRL